MWNPATSAANRLPGQTIAIGDDAQCLLLAADASIATGRAFDPAYAERAPDLPPDAPPFTLDPRRTLTQAVRLHLDLGAIGKGFAGSSRKRSRGGRVVGLPQQRGHSPRARPPAGGGWPSARRRQGAPDAPLVTGAERLRHRRAGAHLIDPHRRTGGPHHAHAGRPPRGGDGRMRFRPRFRDG